MHRPLPSIEVLISRKAKQVSKGIFLSRVKGIGSGCKLSELLSLVEEVALMQSSM